MPPLSGLHAPRYASVGSRLHASTFHDLRLHALGSAPHASGATLHASGVIPPHFWSRASTSHLTRDTGAMHLLIHRSPLACPSSFLHTWRLDLHPPHGLARQLASLLPGACSTCKPMRTRSMVWFSFSLHSVSTSPPHRGVLSRTANGWSGPRSGDHVTPFTPGPAITLSRLATPQPSRYLPGIVHSASRAATLLN